MEHTTKDGRPKLMQRCDYPLTAPGAVSRIYTNLDIFDVVKEQGFVVREMAPCLSFQELQAKSLAKLHYSV